MDKKVDPKDRLLTPGEVAKLYRVDPKTVSRWAEAGRIGFTRTLGGHRRYRESEVRELLRNGFVARNTPSRLDAIVRQERADAAEVAKIQIISGLRSESSGT